MGNRWDDTKRKLERMSREQAPDGWLTLREQALATVPGNERSPTPMKRKNTWILALSTAAAVVAVATLTIVLLLPKPVDVRLEAGKSLVLKNGTLFVNVTTPSGGKIGMPPDAETVDYTLADLTGVFGRNPIPTLPEGYKAASDTVSATMFRTGTIFLMNGITFSTHPEDPEAGVVVFDLNDQGELPLSDCGYGDGTKSTLDGVEMLVGMQTIDEGNGVEPYDVYTATFVANGVGYRIRGIRVPAADFLAVLEATVKG